MKYFEKQDKVMLNVEGISEMRSKGIEITSENVGVVVRTFSDSSVGLPQEVDVDFELSIGVLESIPCEFLDGVDQNFSELQIQEQMREMRSWGLGYDKWDDELLRVRAEEELDGDYPC